MLKTRLIHPQILSALARGGHGSQVLIADGNFPFVTQTAPTAEIVYLNLRPGVVDVSEVLETLLLVVNVEGAVVMQPPDGLYPSVFRTLADDLPDHISVQQLPRLEFYDITRQPTTFLAIATGDDRRFSNVVLTIGLAESADDQTAVS